MLRLTGLLYAIVGTVLSGAAVVAVLVIGWVSFPAILGAAALGYLAALPVAWVIARRMITAPRT